MKKKLSLWRIFNEGDTNPQTPLAKQQQQNVPQTRARSSDLNVYLKSLSSNYGLSMDEINSLISLNDKLKAKNTDLTILSNKLVTFLQDEDEESSEQDYPLPNELSDVEMSRTQNLNDVYADFEGEEEDPAAAAEAQQWQGSLDKLRAAKQNAANQGYYYDPSENEEREQLGRADTQPQDLFHQMGPTGTQPQRRLPPPQNSPSPRRPRRKSQRIVADPSPSVSPSGNYIPVPPIINNSNKTKPIINRPK